MSAAPGSPGGGACLVLRELSKSFGGLQAVRDLDLTVDPGARLGILGPNGAGKTTLFNLITGVFPPTAGQVVLFGTDVTGWSTHRRAALGMARTFQITNLFPRLSVLDNLLLAVQALRPMKYVMWRRLSRFRDAQEKARSLLEQAGFWDRRDVRVENLSHGEQRQVEILLALAGDPRLLLLDEPAAGLSSGESREMASFLRGLDPDLAMVMIEHDLDVAFSVVDTIAVLHYGELLEQGDTAQIRASPRVQEIYLGAG